MVRQFNFRDTRNATELGNVRYQCPRCGHIGLKRAGLRSKKCYSCNRSIGRRCELND